MLSCERYILSLLSWFFFSLEWGATSWRAIVWQVVLLFIGRFTTRIWIMLLHDLVSVFSSKLLEWMVVDLTSCIYCYLVVVCLILETLGSQHTSRLWLHVPMNKAYSHLIWRNFSLAIATLDSFSSWVSFKHKLKKEGVLGLI